MYSWKVFDTNSVERDQYQQEMQYVFPNLSNDDFHNGTDIAIYYNEEIVGGATLKKVTNIKEDPDLNHYWNIDVSISGNRILRLWKKPTASRKTLLYMLSVIYDLADRDNFFYGILSLPLGFAIEKENIFDANLGWLSPKLQLSLCDWDPNENPTSEGRMLLQLYMRMGAAFLGPPSGNVKDRSIRIAMGMNGQKVDLTNIMNAHE